MTGDSDWVMIGDIGLGVWAAFDRKNWKMRAAFAPPESGEETPKEGTQKPLDGDHCTGRGQDPANDNARMDAVGARE